MTISDKWREREMEDDVLYNISMNCQKDVSELVEAIVRNDKVIQIQNLADAVISSPRFCMGCSGIRSFIMHFCRFSSSFSYRTCDGTSILPSLPSPPSPQEQKHKIYWSSESGKYYCQNCKESGDKFHMESTNCKGYPDRNGRTK